MKKRILIIFCLMLLIVPMFAFAQEGNPCSVAGTKDQEAAQALPKCVNQIYVWSLGIGAILALLMMVLGGYRYMTAAGNAENSSQGTEMIWASIIGLAILFGAYLLLNTINPQLVDFKLDSVKCLDSSGKEDCKPAPITPIPPIRETPKP